MFHRSILTEKSTINQFLFKFGFFLYFSKPVLKHIEQFIKGSIQKGYFIYYDKIILNFLGKIVSCQGCVLECSQR